MKLGTSILALAVAIAPLGPVWAQGNAGAPAGSAASEGSSPPVSAVPPATQHSTDAVTNTAPGTPPGQAATSRMGRTHQTGNVANGPTPSHQSGPASTRGPAGGTSARTVQSNTYHGKSYAPDVANVGNSSQANGVIGTNGARASATMENGEPNRQ